MDKKEILAKAQKMGNKDFEKEKWTKSDSVALTLGGAFSGMLILIELLFSKSINFALLAAFSMMLAVQQTVDYSQMKKKHNLMYAFFLYAVGLVSLILFAYNLMIGRVI